MPMSPGPPSKKIRLDIDSSVSTLQQPRILYDRPLAQGNAQVHNGNTQNTFHGPVHYAPSGVAGPAEMGPQTVTNLMEALAFDQMDTRLQTISTAHAKTCQWLFARGEYKTWRDPRALRVHNGFFWIKGKPGAGKSTLMKSALRYGEKAHEDVMISFFFNARGEELQRSLEGMYRSLRSYGNAATKASSPYDLWRRYYNLSCVHHSCRLSDQSDLVYALVLMGAPKLTELEIRRMPSRVTEHNAGEYHVSLLHVAADNGDHRMLTLLIEHGADVNYRGIRSVTSLDLAMKKGDVSMVQALLHGGADPAIIFDHADALAKACVSGKMEMVETFIEHGVLHDPSMTQLAFMQAVYHGHEEVVRKLLDHCVQVDLLLDEKQGTTLTTASRKGREGIVTLLLDRKANVNHRRLDNYTVLHLAVLWGRRGTAQILLNFGSDPNVLSGEIPPGNALHIASSSPDEEVVCILLRHLGPVKTDAHALDENGNHAISLAAKSGHIGCVRALLETEIPLECLHKALEIAASRYRVENRDEIVTMLLAKTGNPGHVHQPT
jgi:ankyrin repeat protein